MSARSALKRPLSAEPSRPRADHVVIVSHPTNDLPLLSLTSPIEEVSHVCAIMCQWADKKAEKIRAVLKEQEFTNLQDMLLSWREFRTLGLSKADIRGMRECVVDRLDADSLERVTELFQHLNTSP